MMFPRLLRVLTLEPLAEALGQRWHYAWVVLASGVLIVTITAGVRNSFGVFVSPLVEQFGWKVGAVSFAYFILFVSGIPLILAGGWLADRFGVRPVALSAAAVFCLGIILTAVMTELWQFYLFYAVLVGGSGVLFNTLLPVTMTQWFHRGVGTAVGLTFAAGGLGPFVLALVFGWLIASIGWKTTFLLVGMLGGIPMLAAVLLVRSRPSALGLRAYGQANPAEAAAAEVRSAPSVGLREIRRQRTIWLLITIHLLGCIGHAVPLAHIVRLAVLKGTPEVLAAGLLSTISMFSILSRLGVPMLVERWNAKLVLSLGYGLQSLAVLLYLWANGLVPLYLVSLVFGLAFGAEMSAFPLLNRQYFGEGAPLNSLHAWEMTGAMVGMGLGGWLGGMLFDVTGSYTASIGLAVLVGLLALPLIAALPRQSDTPLVLTRSRSLPVAVDMHPEHG